MIKVFEPRLKIADIYSVLKTLFKNDISGTSPVVENFEEKLSEKFDRKYAVAVSNGSVALDLAFQALGLDEDDEVILPAFTIISCLSAVLRSNAKPVFCDIDPKTWNIAIESIEKLITHKTKAIMAVSLFGLPLDLEPIMDIAKKHNLVVIDDSAETLCGRYQNKWAGIKADMSVYSFENKKHMTSGSEGGMLITNNEIFAKNVRKFGGLGYKNLTATTGRTNLASAEFQNPNYERHDYVGLNYRMNAITAAVGLAQLERIEHLVERRKAIGEMFLKVVEGCDWLIPQYIDKDITHTFYTFGVIYLGYEKFGVKWEKFYELYTNNGGDGFYAAWVNPYLEPALKNKNYSTQTLNKGLCPTAEDYQKKLMLFKTNYRDLSQARKNVDLLKEMIIKVENNA